MTKTYKTRYGEFRVDFDNEDVKSLLESAIEYSNGYWWYFDEDDMIKYDGMTERNDD